MKSDDYLLAHAEEMALPARTYVQNEGEGSRFCIFGPSFPGTLCGRVVQGVAILCYGDPGGAACAECATIASEIDALARWAKGQMPPPYEKW